MADQNLLNGGSFQVVNGVKVLTIKGTPQQMGYQHGFLLAPQISLMINRTLLATTAYVAAQTGTDLVTAEKMLWEGQAIAEPFLPPEYLQEMEGIYQGVVDAGIKDVSLKQILLWNTNYDQWCIYSHPDYWTPETHQHVRGHVHPSPGAGGCSSFCAWDNWAGGDGKLIFGKDEDNFNMPEQLDNRMMVVAAPKEGFGQVFMSYPGMIGLDGGFNEAGLEMMTQLNSMQYETMAGCGIAIFTRLLLTRCSSVDQAINIFKTYPRCAGIAYHVADAIAKQAAVVETSSKMVCVRTPQPDIKAMWQSNHSNCYPGWMGYSGYNMVADQQPVNKITGISDIAMWQTSLREPYNFYIQAPSRFERYEQLIHQYYGNITPENGLKILCDRYDPYTQLERPKQLRSWTNNILCTICADYPDFTYTAKEPVGTFQAHVANMWSMLAYPETGDFWVAVNDFPAEYGGYVQFNLKKLLGRE